MGIVLDTYWITWLSFRCIAGVDIQSSGKYAMTPLMRQFWIYGALPLSCLFGLVLVTVSIYDHLVFPSVCLLPDPCDLYEYEYDQWAYFWLTCYRIATYLFLGVAAFNAFRVFKLSKNEENTKRKYVVRTSVLFVPVIAIALFFLFVIFIL